MCSARDDKPIQYHIYRYTGTCAVVRCRYGIYFRLRKGGGGFGSRSCILHLIGGDCICKVWTTRQEIDYEEYWDSFFFLVRRCLNSFFHAVFNRSSGKFQSVWRPQKSRNNIFPSDFEYLFFVFFLWLYHRTTFSSSECPPSYSFYDYWPHFSYFSPHSALNIFTTLSNQFSSSRSLRGFF